MKRTAYPLPVSSAPAPVAPASFFALKRAAVVLATGLALSGCATLPEHHSARLASPESALQTPLLPMVVGSPATGIPAEKDATDTRYMFRDTPLPEALRLLFKDSGVNLILADDLNGSVTADFVGMPAERVLSTVLKSHGLRVHYQDATAYVGPEVSRTFHLNYVAGREHQALWDDVETQLSALLSDGGKITVSPLTGTVIVADSPAVMNQVEKHLSHLEEIITRQVLIEAKVIEVTLNDDFEMGIDYSLFPRTFGIGGAVTGTGLGGGALTQGLSSSANSFSFGIMRGNDFSALIKALDTQGQTNILSSPKVSTLNNRTAVINVTEQIPVVSREVITGDVDAQTRELYTVSFEKAGIQLEVTPQISADGTMTVLVHPLVTEVTSTITTPDGLQTLPVINQRETESVLTVKDGDTVLMGGFIQNRLREEVAQVPLLGNLPILGPLFRRTVQSKDRVELVILLTPTVMDPERMASAVADAVSGVNQLTRSFHLGLLHNDRFEPNSHLVFSGFASDSLSGGDKTALGGGFAPVSQAGLAAQAVNRGLERLEKGDTDGAEAAFTTALAIDNDHAEARFQMALLQASRGHSSQALKHFARLASTRPSHPWGINRLALTLTGAGSFDPAIQVLRHGLQQFPDHPALLTNLGVAYMGKGLPELAGLVFEQVERQHPGSVEALLNQAELKAATGNPAQAVALLELALPHMTEQPEYYLRVKRRLLQLTPSNPG